MDEFMRAALEEAKRGFEEGGVPIGAALVSNGKLSCNGAQSPRSGGRSHNARGDKLPVQRGRDHL